MAAKLASVRAVAGAAGERLPRRGVGGGVVQEAGGRDVVQAEAHRVAGGEHRRMTEYALPTVAAAGATAAPAPAAGPRVAGAPSPVAARMSLPRVMVLPFPGGPAVRAAAETGSRTRWLSAG